MSNPIAPIDGNGRRFPWTSDPAAPGTVYVLLGRGGIGMGAGLTQGAHTTFLRPLSDAVRTSVAGDGDTLILSANPNRMGFSIVNDSSEILYLAYGAAEATLSSYTLQVPPGAYFEDPWQFTGEVRGIWDDEYGAGDVRVTEIVLA